MKVIIDRFEGSFAVCEKDNREMINIEKSSIPVEAKDGDVLNIIKATIVIDREATERRKKKIAELTKELWQ